MRRLLPFFSQMKPYYTFCSLHFFSYFIYLGDDFTLALRDLSLFPRTMWNPGLKSWALSALSLLDSILCCSYPDLPHTLHGIEHPMTT